MKIKLNIINALPIMLPERMILTRLGYNHHLTGLTPRQKDKIMQDMHEAFALCRPRGVWARMAITDNDGETLRLQDGTVFRSRALCSLMSASANIWIAATTVGHELLDAIAAVLARSDGNAALIYDAVGGEVTDAAMDYLQKYVNKNLSRSGEKLSAKRFSPGYSDLNLEAQRDIFRILELEKFGLELNERMLILPEKSVTALAGIEINI